MNPFVSPDKKTSVVHRSMANALFVFLLVCVIGVNLFSSYQVSRFTAVNQSFATTYQVIQSVNDILTNTLDVESVSRGYVITGDEFLIKDLDQEYSSIKRNFDKSMQMTFDNPDQQISLSLLLPLLEERTALTKKMVELKKSGKSGTADAIALIPQGEEITNRIKESIETIKEHEFNALSARNDKVLEEMNYINVILLTASVLTIAILLYGIGVLNFNLSRQIRAIKDKHETDRVLNGIINGTNDMIVALDQDFNFIAFNRVYEEECKKSFGKHIKLGMSLLDVFGSFPDVLKENESLWARALKGEEFNYVHALGRSESSQSLFETSFSTIYDDDGVLIGAAAIIRNVQNRIDYENSLKAVNENLFDAKEKVESSFHELKEHDSQMSLLNEMEHILLSCHTIEEVLALTVKYCKTLLPFSAGIVYLLNSSRNYLEKVSSWRNAEMRHEVFSSDQCWSLRQARLHRFISEEEGIHCQHLEGKKDIKPYLCVPLLAQTDVLGLLYLEVTHGNEMDPEEVKILFEKHELLITNLSGQVALAIANIKLRDTLRIRSIRDPLTGLYNRTYLNETLDRDLQRSKRNNLPLAIAMMDIDNFKDINDKYGHEAGDIMLKGIGDLLLSRVRAGDIACRYGGDEILLVFYETDHEHIRARAEELRKEIGELKFSFHNKELDPITISMGVALYPDDSDDAEFLIDLADQALYNSKQNGRNQVTTYKLMAT